MKIGAKPRDAEVVAAIRHLASSVKQRQLNLLAERMDLATLHAGGIRLAAELPERGDRR